LLTAALVAIPAATSRNLSKNLAQYSFLSGFLGMVNFMLALLLFEITKLPIGPLIIIVASSIFIISSTLRI